MRRVGRRRRNGRRKGVTGSTPQDVISQLELQHVAELEQQVSRAKLKLRGRVEAGAIIEPGPLNSPDLNRLRMTRLVLKTKS
jgi:hypothetical protein